MDSTTVRLNAALESRYSIERVLGQGGMATVYLAHDVKHDRKVALKVLKPELAAVVGADRFLAEIRTTANLQHPHILPLFDSGEADGFLYFVMPYVEGEPLQDRLDREKQLPVDEAVRIACEVADALGHAHASGVIHRDIKPANILLRDGRVQVADFGIALALQQAGGARLTETGLSVGTPHYMSPEQASGERVLDARSDIYSLGCVLYEMLAGEPPHTGPTAQAILSKILTEEPRPLSQVRHSTPRNVEATVHTSLASLPADRFASAAAFADALRNPAFTAGLAVAHPARSLGGWPGAALVASAAGVLAVAAAAWGWLRNPAGARSSPGAVVSVIGESRHLTYGNTVAISPDGRTVIYVGGEGLEQRLYRRQLDDLEPTPIPGTEGAQSPFFSPDGEWVGFTRALGIRKVPLSGGSVVTVIADSVGVGGGASWYEGWIYFILWPGRGLGPIVRVPQDGGQIDTVWAQDPRSARDISWWTHLPDGRSLLASEWTGRGPLSILARPTGDIHVRSPLRIRVPKFIPPATLVFGLMDGTILAAPFDPERGEFTGTTTVLARNVEVVNQTPQFAVSAAGAIVYVEDDGDDLAWESLDGTRTRPVTNERRNLHVTASSSPDGSRVAVTVFEGDGQEIRVYDANGRGQNVTRGEQAQSPLWTPDGRWLVYGSRDRGILRRPSDTGGDPEFVVQGAGGWMPTSWSPSGERLVYTKDSVWQGWLLELATGDSILLGEDLTASGPADFTPDGSLIALQSMDLERAEVYVQRLENEMPAGDRVRVSFEGGIAPHWSPDGRTLYYVRWRFDEPLAARLVAVEIERSPVLRTGRETVLADWSGQGVDLAYRFDLHPNGTEVVRVRSRPTRHVVLLQNWRSLLGYSTANGTDRR